MAYSPIAFTAANYRDYKFHWIKAYEPGTTTPKAMALFIDGSTQVSKLQINSDGFIISAGSALVIPYINGAYDLWLFRTSNDADNNDTSNAVRLADNITAVGISSGSASDISETPPANPYDGARWTRCTDMKAFLWYVDADGGQWIEDRPSFGLDTIQNLTLTYEFATLEGDPNSAIESTITFPVGKKISWDERQTGTGGGGSGVIALTSDVTPNALDIIASVGSPTKSIILQTKRQTVELDQLGANIGDGYTAMQYAVDNYQTVIGNSPLYDTSAAIIMPEGNNLITKALSKINATADTEAIIMRGQYANLEGFQIETTFVGHTKNLVEVGGASTKPDRCKLSNLIVTGAGNDGIYVINGNLGSIDNVTSTGNGRDGINFDGLLEVDNLNWNFSGYCDFKDNGRDGLHLAEAISTGDAHASRKHTGAITTQGNTRYGSYIGTISNDLTIYSESNTVRDIYLDTQATGNKISIIEGQYTEITEGNIITTFSMNANRLAGYKTTLKLAGGARGGFWIDNDDGNAGVFTCKKTGVREITHTYATSAAAWNVYHDNDTGFGVLTWFDGDISPLRDNLWTCGSASNRWTTIYATSGTVNTSDEREKTALIDVDEAEKLVGLELKGLIKKYKWLDAIEKKGDGARLHFGIGAQTVKSTFEKHGLDGFKYGCLCYDEWDEQPEIKDEKGNITTKYKAAGNRYGIRPDELLFLIIASI